jgi:integrating conjugative element protein (TIGR03757 family)
MLNPMVKLILLIGCCPGMFQFAQADADLWPKSLIVVTSSKRQISNINKFLINIGGVQPDIKIHNLDAVTNIEQRLSEGLPIDPVEAQTVAEQRITQIGRSQLDAELRSAYLPLGTMMAYALDRYPVIIFDQTAVIYGITDLRLATSKYREWLKEKQEVMPDE